MKRTALKRSGFKRKGSGQLHDWPIIVKAAAEREHNRCQACGEYVSAPNPFNAHHYLSRGRGGSDEPSNIIFCCNLCHRHFHSQPSWAKEHGWTAPKGYKGE